MFQPPVLMPPNDPPPPCPTPNGKGMPPVRAGDCCAPGVLGLQGFLDADARYVQMQAARPNIFVGLSQASAALNTPVNAGTPLTVSASLPANAQVLRATSEPIDAESFVVTSYKINGEEMLKEGAAFGLSAFAAALPAIHAQLPIDDIWFKDSVDIEMTVQNITGGAELFHAVTLHVWDPSCRSVFQKNVSPVPFGQGAYRFSMLVQAVKNLFGL